MDNIKTRLGRPRIMVRFLLVIVVVGCGFVLIPAAPDTLEQAVFAAGSAKPPPSRTGGAKTEKEKAKTPPAPYHTETVTWSLEEGNVFIEKDPAQHWMLNVKDEDIARAETVKIINVFNAQDVRIEQVKTAGPGTQFDFKVQFNRLTPLKERLKTIGILEERTVLPTVRPEILIGSAGRVNTKVLEVLVPVKLFLKQ